MNKLQVLIDSQWQFVFCRNPLFSAPIITHNKLKAIKGDNRSLEYFQQRFGNHQFRILKQKGRM